MKTVTVLKTFENEGEVVRPARPGQKPNRITVDETRARQLLKSGLVGDAEDAEEPTKEELEELAVRGFASATVDSSDSSVITIRVRTARQADALRGMFRETIARAKEHVAGRKAAGEVVDGGAGETATSVLFADNRQPPGGDVIVTGDGKDDAPADDGAGGTGEAGEGDQGGAADDGANSGGEGGEGGETEQTAGGGETESSAGATEGAEAGGQTGGETGGADTTSAGGEGGETTAGAPITGDGGPAPAPDRQPAPRRPRGQRGGAAAE